MPLTARQRSIHSKNGAKRTTSFNKGRTRKNSGGEYLVTNAPTDLRSISYPGGAVTLVLLLIARISSALWGHIADCDETYNYWEPLHYLVYGSGFQTWEYSPEFALRSYLPLWLFAVPAKILSIALSPTAIFYAIRILLATFTAIAELMFYKAVCHEFGVHVGRAWLAFALPAAGAWAASAAMLPAAWSLALSTAAAAAWWRRRYAAAVLFTAASAIASWPFTVLLGVPIAIDIVLMKRKLVDFLRCSILALLLILLPTVAVDSWHYGRLVVAPWNIVKYNVFTEHGPDLYGVEPWSFYFINGFLNFNIVWLLALSCPVLLLACGAVTGAAPRAAFCLPYRLSLAAAPLWLAVFALQPHKEERFLYPIYSMITLCGAISVDCLQKIAFALGERVARPPRRHYLACTAWLFYLFVVVAGLAGISRTVALYKNYHGPMSILQRVPAGSVLCYGKEWHRSPSSFHLQGSEIRFVKSDFDGQMPAPYAAGYNATRLIHPYFNDLNRENNATYISPERCHYLVDSDLGAPTPRQPAYHRQDRWEVIDSAPLLDAPRSHRLLRAFYVPVLSDRHLVYGSIYLLRNKQIAV